jgi:hypothetical protein
MKWFIKRWMIILGLILVVSAGAVIALAYWMSGDSTGTMHVGTPHDSPEAAQTLPQPLPVSAASFTTTLPAGFEKKRQTDTPDSNGTLLQYLAINSKDTDQNLAITMAALSADGLAGVGDYHLRSTGTATYQAYTPSYLPAGATAFQNIAGQPGVTIFWPHGATYAEVTLSTDKNTPLSDLDISAAYVLSHWKWLK